MIKKESRKWFFFYIIIIEAVLKGGKQFSINRVLGFRGSFYSHSSLKTYYHIKFYKKVKKWVD
ncbi:hypothetical protein RBU49_08140 [Clostridium sp. MB40-C1]|uniref:hypothetical protein n=1 Tax=Clostridium sp. MB40-C1 TaxID=3070996 RepID=UPI0027DF600D|nr:hypothetical protein [Clostridium sp. MB40-C1]WMJ82209.1 hypothetical protein RBU49_08140 [Clostridium sp. MB40-C1]